jgi:ribosome-binding protein aMBF1 (putative translation factor)
MPSRRDELLNHIDDRTDAPRARSRQRLRRERNRDHWTPGWCQDEGMADILPFPQRRTPTPEPEPEPLWRELLGQSLRAAREEQGGRLVDIAGRAGISPQYLSEIERGRKEPSSEMIAAVTGALGVDLADLLAGIAGTVRQRPGASLTQGRRPAGPVLMAA